MGLGAKLGIGVSVIAIVLLLVSGAVYVSTINREVALRNEASAQQDVCKLVHDTVWKILKQKGQVAETAASKYLELFPALMEGRYGNARGGALLSFVQEQNPTFDLKLYEDLSRAIEAQRETFLSAQKRLRDIKREHDDLRQKIPSTFFVGQRPELKIQLITSTQTEATYATGTDDDVDLFQKQSK